jgi:hypothetical protein
MNLKDCNYCKFLKECESVLDKPRIKWNIKSENFYCSEFKLIEYMERTNSDKFCLACLFLAVISPLVCITIILLTSLIFL